MRTQSLEILQNSQLPAAQAHAILRVMEMEFAAGSDTLATKLDLSEARSELKSEIAALRAELKSDFAALESQLNKVEGSLSRWVLTCMLGQTAVLAGLGYFALEHLKR